MKLTPYFTDRAFSSIIPPALDFEVERYNTRAVGGCDQATITATGGEMELWGLLNMLRYGVEIQDDLGNARWWGFVNEVVLEIGNISIGASLDTMSNKICVAYSYVDPGSNDVGQRRTTSWITDADSVSEYGTKEWIKSLSGATTAQANNLGTALLSSYKYPVPVTDFTQGGRVKRATITCKRWWYTLGWRYASYPAGAAISCYPQTVYDANFGIATRVQRGQSFLVGTTGINILSITAQFKKVGAPTDSLKWGIMGDASGSPSQTWIATASIAGTAMTTAYVNYTGTLSAEGFGTSSTRYWMIYTRTGAVDAANYYSAGYGSATSYSNGSTGFSTDGTAWTSNADSNDFFFSVNVNSSIVTTLQAQNLITNYGEFITAVDIDDVSGISSASYRDGDTTALSEVIDLLDTGTSSGRRLLAEVDRNRRVRIYVEPTNGTINYYYLRSGELADAVGNPLARGELIAGVWCALKDIIPVVVDLTILSSPTPFFIEACEWDNQAKAWMITPRGQVDPWKVGYNV